VNISPGAWAQLVAAGTSHSYEQGAVLLRQGTQPSHVLALIAGRVKVSRSSSEGAVLVLATRGPCELLGEISVLGGEDRSATVVATDRCDTRIIRADRFLRLVRSLDLQAELLRHAMARIREGEQWRAELATLPARPRLARTLIRLARPDPPGPADVDLDQAELGLAAGLARSTVAAELAHLRRLGIVVTTRRRIVITDLARLRHLSNPGAQTSDFRQ
jgi:CRP/FNR family cyclic AMP-dependent transcriptional regulator